MPSLKAIRTRIASVKNTQKITRAMKLVAAARLRRAQDAIIAARPYSEALERVVSELAERAGREAHPLLAERPGKRAQVLVLTSDRGLAGSFNAQLFRRTEAVLAEDLSGWDETALRVVGRKGNEFFKRRQVPIIKYIAAPTSATALDVSRELANHLVHDFLEEKADRFYLIYSEFLSAMSQKPVVRQLLPIEPRQPTETETKKEKESQRAGDFLYEPSKEELLEHLLPLYVQNGIYRAALESIASELGARMSAMDSATRNAGEMIDRLTLQYNRARQAAITKELLEIIGGAEALKG
ncbi:MAG TPA: ATP synthase F1 subunit gamma [Kofleriaceae bacterium]|nr:ATP synthase F1 subunit gamma [Kofleriaceae bacterium]